MGFNSYFNFGQLVVTQENVLRVPKLSGKEYLDQVMMSDVYME